MMNSSVTVSVHCDSCEAIATLVDNHSEKSSTLDNVSWRAVRDLVMTTEWFRITFPDARTFREYHVCGKSCAETLLERQYLTSKSVSEVEPS